jgi:hypothetical protein
VVAVASEVEVICVSSGWGAGLPDTFSKVSGLRSGTIPGAAQIPPYL